jgi:zinc protease
MKGRKQVRLRALRGWSLGILAASLMGSAACGSSPALTPLPPPPPPATSAPAPVPDGSTAWQPTPDAPFRAQAPEAAAQRPWTAPVATETKLTNGMRVLFVSRPTLPIIVVQVVSPRGADQQPFPGMGSFVGAMLEQGTTTRSAFEISDAYLDIGAKHGAWVDWDSTNVWMQVLPQHLSRGVEVLSDVIRNPAFAPDEVDRVRSQRLASIQQQADRPRAIVSNTIARSLYGGHAYGESILGTAGSLKRVTSNGLKALHRALVAPNETFVVVVGNITQQDVTPILEKSFGSWKGWSPPRRQVRPPVVQTRKIVVIDRKGASQSNIAIAGVGVPRTTQDFDAVLMGNTVLGGMFSSRLNMNLREKHAFTYGAYSYFDMRHGPGPFMAGAAVDTPKTGPALKEVLDELERFCTTSVTGQELQLALGRQVKSLPGRFESAGATAGAIADLGVFGLRLDEFRTRPVRLQGVKAEEVQRAAAAHFNPDHMQIVVAGDVAVIKAQLAQLAFGPIEIVDAESAKVIERIPVPKPYRSFSCEAP